jgi:hypothetical protein
VISCEVRGYLSEIHLKNCKGEGQINRALMWEDSPLEYLLTIS